MTTSASCKKTFLPQQLGGERGRRHRGELAFRAGSLRRAKTRQEGDAGSPGPQGVSSLNKTQGREWQSQRHLATKCKLYRARSGPRSGQFLSAQLLNHILLLHLPITLAINIKKDISRTITDSIFSGPSKTLESKNRRQRRLDTQDYPAPLALNAFRFDFEAHGKQTNVNSNKKAERENETVLVQVNFYNPIGQGPRLFSEPTLRSRVRWAARSSEYKVSDRRGFFCLCVKMV